MTKKKLVDLGSIDPVAACNIPHEFELRHPHTDKPLGIFWSVYGKESDRVREHARDNLNAMLKKDRMFRKSGKDNDQSTVESIEKETVESLVICSAGWRTDEGNVLNFKGELLEFNVPNVFKVLNDVSMIWVRKQISEESNDLGNFMQS